MSIIMGIVITNHGISSGYGYGAPEASYGAPEPSYGAPSDGYGAPARNSWSSAGEYRSVRQHVHSFLQYLYLYMYRGK